MSASEQAFGLPLDGASGNYRDVMVAQQFAEWDRQDMGSSTKDAVLDALDDAPTVTVSGFWEEGDYVGPAATVQHLAALIGASETTVRRTVERLVDAGLAYTTEIVDPKIRRRRLLVIGSAA